MDETVDTLNYFRSDKIIGDQIIEVIKGLEKRIAELEKVNERNKAFRDNVIFDIEEITRRISSEPIATKKNVNKWDDLKKQARNTESFYLNTEAKPIKRDTRLDHILARIF